MQYTIPKIKSGELSYTISLLNRTIKLDMDLPANNSGKGAFFSKKAIPFDVLNSCLQKGIILTGSKITSIISGTINTGTMLLAVLFHLGCVDRNGRVLKKLSSGMTLP